MDWLTDHKLPIGRWAKNFVDWLTDNALWVFDGISLFLETLIDGILWLLQAPNPLVVVAIAAGIGYAVHRTIAFTVFVAVALLLIINQGYWEETTETLALVIAASVVCMAVGVPVGVLGGTQSPFLRCHPAPA